MNNNKKLYYIISILINVLICMGGAWTLLVGLFCMSGSFGSKFSKDDFIIGLIIYICTYLLAGIVNYVIYKFMKNKLNLGLKYFIIPTVCVYIIGLIYTFVLLL